MKGAAFLLAGVALAGLTAAPAQTTDTAPGPTVSVPMPPPVQPAAPQPAPGTQPAPQVLPNTPQPSQPPPGSQPAPGSQPSQGTLPPPGPPQNAVLELKALDKITGKATLLMAPLNKPVRYETLTVTARTCYSTPPSETPETSAFLQIEDRRPDQPERRVFSGWMYASSPGLNALQHPLYDVWVISCITSTPGQQPAVAATAPVKPVSPNAGANEAMPTLPEDAGQ